MITILKIVSSGMLFLLTIGTGVWLSNSGKSYNNLIFAAHKLIALAAVIFTAFLIRSLLKNVEIKTVIVALIIAAVAFVLALFISGALMSIGIAPYSLFKTVHIIVTILTAGTTAAVLHLLLNRKL